MPRWWAGVALLAVVIGGALAWAFHTTTEVQVSTATVTVGPIARRIFATGTLQPVTTVEVGTQVSGIVQTVLADYNSTVRQGQVVAKLDPSLYDAQLRAAIQYLEELIKTKPVPVPPAPPYPDKRAPTTNP